MEPASLLTSIISTTLVIKTWLRGRQSKNVHIRALLKTIEQAHLIHDELAKGCQSHEISDGRIIAALQAIAETICLIKDHLSIWKEKSYFSALLKFISSGSVLNKLRDDEQLLSLQISVLSLALSVSTFSKGNRITIEEHEQPEALVLKLIKNPDVIQFWEQMIGHNVRPNKVIKFICI